MLSDLNTDVHDFQKKSHSIGVYVFVYAVIRSLSIIIWLSRSEYDYYLDIASVSVTLIMISYYSKYLTFNNTDEMIILILHELFNI